MMVCFSVHFRYLSVAMFVFNCILLEKYVIQTEGKNDTLKENTLAFCH